MLASIRASCEGALRWIWRPLYAISASRTTYSRRTRRTSSTATDSFRCRGFSRRRRWPRSTKRLAELTAAEGDRAGLEVHQERGTDRLADLVNKDPRFEVCFSHPRVLAAMQHVLGEFRLSSLNSRAALPGEGHQGLHADFGHPVQPGEYEVCNSIWLLDDFTPSNGATRVVPGSHRRGTMPGDEMPNPGADHPDQIQLTRQSRHGSHLQQPPLARRHPKPNQQPPPSPPLLLHPPPPPQQLDQQTYIRLNTYTRLTPAQHFILDVTN